MADWYNASWLSRELITIDHTKVSGTLSNFPVCFDINDANLDIWTKAQANGNDILFTLSDGTTKLSHELSKYDNSGKELISYVEVPTLSNSVDTGLYMYYENAGAGAQEDVAGTWGVNAKGIWHFEGNVNASVGTNGVVTGTVNYKSGIIGQAGYVSANSNYVTVTDAALAFANTSNYTWFALVQTPANTAPWEEILRNNGAPCIMFTYSNKFQTYNGGNKIHPTLLGGASDRLFTYRYDSSGVDTVDLFVDNTKESFSATATSLSSPMYFFCDHTGASHYNGFICDMRAYDIALSDDWINTTYENLVNNSSFFTIGGEAEGLPPNIRRQLRSEIKSYNLRRREFVGN